MSSIAVTPGSGANVATVVDGSGVNHPLGVMEFMVGATPTQVTSSAPLPVTFGGGVVLAAGTAVIGHAIIDSGSVAVSSLPALAAGTAVIGHVVVDTAPTTAVTGTFWQATQPVSAASLPLPAGASTEATLATLSGKVTACNTGAVVISGALPAGTAVIGHVVVDSTPTTAVTGTFWQATQPVSGSVTVLNSGFAVVGNVEVTNDVGNPLPVNGTVTANIGMAGTLALESGGNLATIAGKDFATQTTLAALNAKVTACNTGAVTISAALPAGTNVIGHVVVDTAPTTAVTGTFWQATQPVSLASLPALAAGTSTIGSVSLSPATSGGLSTSSAISAATTNATSVKASAGQVFGYAIFNASAAAKFVKLYDKASAPTVGSDTPVRRLLIPAGGGVERTMPNGLQFGTGIAYAITGASPDADTTAVAVGDVLINIDYK